MMKLSPIQMGTLIYMNFLLLLPGLFTLLEKVVGPMMEGQAGSIASKVMALGNSVSSSGIMSAIQSVIGNINDQQRLELNAELQVLLANCAINQTEASSNESFFYKGPRPTAFWVFLGLAGIHCAFAESFNILHALGYQVGLMAPMDNMAWYMLGGLAGIWAIGRSVEKVNSNNNPQPTSDDGEDQ